MGGSSPFKAPIKLAQTIGVLKKKTTPPPTPAPTVEPVVSPTVAEVSQSEAANASSYDLRKTKRKGRSATIMTGPAGVKNEDLVLGKRSLLGS